MKNIGFILIVAVIMGSCSKEESLETGGTGGGGTGGGVGGGVTGAKLVKIVSSLPLIPTIEIAYDASNRMTKILNAEDLGSGPSVTSEDRYIRDATGRIIRNESLDDFNDSIAINYVYVNGTDRKVKYGMVGVEAGSDYRDSIAFTYTGEFCTKIAMYESVDAGESYEMYEVTTFKYDAKGNVIEVLESDVEAGTISPAVKYVYEYDNKTNPAYFRDDVLLLRSDALFLSPNNPVKLTFTALQINLSIPQSVTYQYRSDNKPSKASGTFAAAPYTLTYNYQ